MAIVTAEEAGRMAYTEQRQMNAGRMLPPTLSRISRLMKDETFPICNVGPWPYRCERACLTVQIPAYDPAQDAQKLGYAASEPQPVIRREAKIISEDEFTFVEDDGRLVAQDLIGVGPFMHPMNSLLRYGVFIPAGPTPTRDELAAARAKLSEYTDFLIQEARDAYDKGPDERKAVISDRHLWAGRERGLDEPWLHHQHAQSAILCTSCGRRNPAGIAKCQCGSILDFELYLKNEEQQREMLNRAAQMLDRSDKQKKS